jgi:hypothetical protein
MTETTQNSLAFPAFKSKRKTGDESFTSSDKSLDLQLSDFWKWSVSDLVSNATRGILAEFLVASALGLTVGIRSEWDAFDISFGEIKIEVKSAAYLQSWAHAKLSDITFTIRQTYAWDSQTNTSSTELRRQANLYIFCLLKHLDKETIDPMNLDQWEFYLLPSKILDEQLPIQKTISLAKLLRLKPCIAKYEELACCVKKMTTELS